jgi:hypothetical protein
MNQKSLLIFLLFVTTSLFAQIPYIGQSSDYTPSDHPTKVMYPTNFYVSEPVRDMPQCIDQSIFDTKVVPRGATGMPQEMSAKRQRKLKHLHSAGTTNILIDPMMQGPESYSRSSGTRAPIANFEGIGLEASPPDPSMAVGPNHVVTMENGLWSVYSKMGVQAPGFPKNLNNPLSGPNHGDNAGDPIVMYDREADRWFISQFQLSGFPSLSDDVFLIGISTTPDPTGTYNVYEYELAAGNDYPHYGVWGDSYITAGNFTGAQKVYTFNRIKMLAGDGSAEIVGFSPSGLGANGFAAPIPVHSERNVTPTGPIKIVYYQDDAYTGVRSDHIGMWNIIMDWNNIGSSTISGKIQIPTAPFDAAIAGGFSNLQQPGTAQRIDAIVGAVMNMCHWYEFGTHQSIVMNWVVEIENNTQKSGIRWVELRSTTNGTSWSVYQEGTYTDPTAANVAQKESVFMGCISMDMDGNIGLGYTKTGSSTFPSLYYTGRLASDPLGDMTFGENLAIAGTNSVTTNDRYGDYGQGVTDPSDDKTFWVTSEYSGSSNRRVRIYSYKIEAATPEISFSTTAESLTESNTACFTDIDVPLSIALAPSQDAIVNFVINNMSSTATSGNDYELLTSSVTFLAGETTNKLMSLRVYHDGQVEVDENVTINFTVNPNGGDAEANTNANAYTLTISSTDTAPVPTQNVALFSDGFETYSDFEIGNIGGWTMLDNDGDTSYGSTTYNFTNESYTGTFIVFNPSQTSPTSAGSAFDAHTGDKGYYCFDSIGDVSGTAENDDYIFTPQINLTGSNKELSLWARSVTADFGLEQFRVGISTTNTNPRSFVWFTPTPQDAPITWTEFTYDLNFYSGPIYLAIHVISQDAFTFMLDDIAVTADVSVGVQTAENAATAEQIKISGAGTSYAFDLNVDNSMASITNNLPDDYGCATVAVSRSGNGVQGYNGSTGVSRVMDKRFTITESNIINNGDVDITFYFTEAEINGLEGLTLNNRNTLYIAREVGGNLEDVVAATIGPFGSNVTLTGSFTGLDGDFYFGRQEAFLGCLGPIKIWNGVSWNPIGTPDSTNTIIINGDYNTSNGNLEACELTISGSAIVTVRANEYLNIQGNITVDGTLIVEHQGSVVQANPTATVTKNPTTGFINVNVTTPVLQQRAFMVMGSPMDIETRGGVFTNAFLVLDHTPNNFNPNTHPNIPQGATNFSDLEGDFWTSYSGGINPGEGYIVRPQTGYGDPAGITYDMTYALGTLNNGTVNRPMIYNVPNSPAGTPNVYANPYPSAINSDVFIQDNGLNALYFWEHLTPPSVIVPGEGLKFDMDDVSIRNDGGGVPANNDNPLNIPTNVISTGQGFAIKATTNGTVSFTNDMRLTTGNTTLRTNEEEVDRLWLHIESDEYQLANNMLLGFNPQATAGIDTGYDTDRLACSVSLYSQLETGDARMSIQTRESFSDAMKIPVGFSTLIEEETGYTISLSNFEGDNLIDRAIYIYDTELNILIDLTQGDYTFRSDVASQDRRFTVVFERDEEVLGTNEGSLDGISVYPNPTNGTLHIVSTRAQLEAVKVYDVLGRQVAKENLDNVQGYQLDMSRLKTAVYFVEIITPQGTIIKRILKK